MAVPYVLKLMKHNAKSSTTAYLRTVVDLCRASGCRHQCDDVTVNGFIWRWRECVCYHS